MFGFKLTPSSAFVATFFLTTAAQAEGYYSGFKGATAAGRAGAFVVKADDISAAFYNPANFALMNGTLLQFSNRLSFNASSFQRAPTDHDKDPLTPNYTFAKVNNEETVQGIEPLLGIATDFGLNDWGFALTAGAPGGVGRLKFPVDGGQRYLMINRDAQILTYSASIAWKLKELLGLGVSLQWIHVPKLEYSLIVDGNPFGEGTTNPVESTFDLLATTKGSDPFTFNAIVGAWFQPSPSFEIGLSGQIIPSQIKTKSTLDVQPISTGFSEEVTLSREGVPANDVTLTLPLPMTARLGFRYINRAKTTGHENFDIELDIAYSSWSQVGTFDVATNGLAASLEGEYVSLGTIQIPKQWNNTLTFHLGGDYNVIPQKLTLRAGAFYESSVAKPAYANVDFVGGTQVGGALGASMFFGAWELALAYGLRVQPKVTVSETEGKVYRQDPASPCQPPFGDPTIDPTQCLPIPPVVNAGTYTASTNSLSIDVKYRF